MAQSALKYPLENCAFQKRYRIKAAPQTLRVKDSTQIFALANILGSAESALVVWTLRGWLAVNEAKKHNFREGRYWTYNSLPQWCAQHFPWLSAKQLSTIMKHLEDQGVIIRKQFKVKHEFDNQYWYSVNEEVLTAMTAGKHLPAVPPARMVASSSQMGSSSAQMGAPSAQTGAYTTKESTRYESSISDTHSLSTTTAFEDDDAKAVVVDPSSHRDPEPESGEHSIDGEGPDTTAVKAFVPHEQHHNDQPISKVPLKVLPTEGTLCGDLICFGITPDRAQWITQQYPEGDVRYVLAFAQAATSLSNPPGFVVGELAKGAAGVLGLRGTKQIFRRSLSEGITDDAEREERMRRETARWDEFEVMR